MLWKCCTQYASKSGKLSSGHRTGKVSFIPIPWKAMLKNVQTTAQLHSCHMPARLYSKFSKLDFSSMWTKNFQMYKLVLKKAEEPEIKLPVSSGSWEKEESSRKTSTFALLTIQRVFVWITTNCGKFFKRWEYQTLWPASWETCMWVKKQQEATVRTGHGKTDWFQIGKGVH